MVPVSSPRTKALRLAFCARSTARGGVDGAWWPTSTNLSAQLPDLVSILGLTIGEVRRVVYDPSRWPPTPPRIIKGSNAISVDPYHAGGERHHLPDRLARAGRRAVRHSAEECRSPSWIASLRPFPTRLVP